jgi:hypothetical protein
MHLMKMRVKLGMPIPGTDEITDERDSDVYVNLDNVTYMYPSVGTDGKMGFQIHFVGQDELFVTSNDVLTDEIAGVN